jgi:hypothetical protein
VLCVVGRAIGAGDVQCESLADVDQELGEVGLRVEEGRRIGLQQPATTANRHALADCRVSLCPTRDPLASRERVTPLPFHPLQARIWQI